MYISQQVFYFSWSIILRYIVRVISQIKPINFVNIKLRSFSSSTQESQEISKHNASKEVHNAKGENKDENSESEDKKEEHSKKMGIFSHLFSFLALTLSMLSWKVVDRVCSISYGNGSNRGSD